MRQGDVTDWSRESWEAAREFAYGTLLADPCALPAGTVPTERPVITEEITRRLIPIVRRQAGARRAPAGPPARRGLPARFALAQAAGAARRTASIYSGTTVTARRFWAQAASLEPGRPGAPCPS